MRATRSRLAAVAVVGCGLAALALPVSDASAACASLHVTDSSDVSTPDAETLRHLVDCADTGDTIIIDSGIDPVLTGPGIADPSITITKNLTITGQGVGATSITVTNHDDRAFIVNSGKALALSNLTISGGKAPDGGDGGAATSGDPGEDGGAILNHGSLELSTVTITDSAAGDGGDGGDGANGASPGIGAAGGAGGRGGAIFSDGVVGIDRSTFTQNSGGVGGVGGNGGNRTSATGDGGVGGVGGSGGDGGAIFVESGTLSIGQSTLGGPTLATGNDGGTGGQGGNGGAGGSMSGNQGSGGQGGPGGDGGALAAGVSIGDANLFNVTIAGNQGGGGGSFGSGSGILFGGAGGAGGGLQASGPLSTHGVTVSGNVTGPGGGIFLVGGSGGGVKSASGGSLTLRSTLVAGNSVAPGGGNANCTGPGTLVDGGQNLSFPAGTGCPGATGNPLLGPLANNGGPTLTMALGAGSAAIDADPGRCLFTDQRGVSRPQGPACDIGAFEAPFVPPVVTPAPAAAATTAAKKKCKKGRKLKRGKCVKKKKKK